MTLQYQVQYRNYEEDKWTNGGLFDLSSEAVDELKDFREEYPNLQSRVVEVQTIVMITALNI